MALDVEYRIVYYWDDDFGGCLYKVCEVVFDTVTGEYLSFSPTSLGCAEFKCEIESDIRRIEYALDQPVMYEAQFKNSNQGKESMTVPVGVNLDSK